MRRWYFTLFLLLALGFLFIWLFQNNENIANDSGESQKHPEMQRSIRIRELSDLDRDVGESNRILDDARSHLKILDENHELIKNAINALEQSELKRAVFSSEAKPSAVSPGTSINFFLSPLSDNELDHLTKIIEKIDGYREDDFNTTLWSDYLKAVYALKYSSQTIEVFVNSDERNNAVSTIMTAVDPDTGEKKMVIMPSYVISSEDVEHSRPIKWRFSHLLDLAEETKRE